MERYADYGVKLFRPVKNMRKYVLKTMFKKPAFKSVRKIECL